MKDFLAAAVLFATGLYLSIAALGGSVFAALMAPFVSAAAGAVLVLWFIGRQIAEGETP